MHEFRFSEPAGRIFQINRSKGGVPKLGVHTCRVTPLGLDGDGVNHPKIHGGPERALCLYSLERILALQKDGHPVFPGSLGENLTLSGLDWSRLAPGQVMRFGSEDDACAILLQRFVQPCKTVSASFRDGDFRRVDEQRHPGWSRLYASVITPGMLHTGQPVFLSDL